MLAINARPDGPQVDMKEDAQVGALREGWREGWEGISERVDWQ